MGVVVVVGVSVVEAEGCEGGGGGWLGVERDGRVHVHVAGDEGGEGALRWELGAGRGDCCDGGEVEGGHCG